MLFRIFTLLPAFLLFNSEFLQAGNYYWVGNSGNWSDYASHWATSSGGASFHTQLPTASDNVFFDANSFSSGSQTVTIDTNAVSANLDFTGITNTPTISGTNSYTITCAGSLTFVAGMNFSFTGNVQFTGTGIHTVTSAGKSFNGNMLFNGTGGQWTLQDALTVSGQLGLQAGALLMNGQDVSCGTINANIVDNTRTVNFGASLVTVTGSGTCIDLRGNTGNLTVAVGTSTISCSTTSNLTIQTGVAAKSIPNLVFPNITTGNININTGNAANRITFGSITKINPAPSLNTSTGGLIITGPTMNTYGDIALPENTYVNIRNRDGSSYGAGDISIYTGTVSIGDGSKTYNYGDYCLYQQDITFGENVDVYYQDETEFDGVFIVGSTAGTYGMEFRNGARFDNTVLFYNSSRIQSYNNTIDFNSTLTTNSYGTFNLIYGNNATLNFNSTVTVGNNTVFNIGNGGTGTTNFNSALILNQGAQLQIDNNSSTTTINNLTLNDHCSVSFNSSGTNSITGTLISSAGCNSWILLNSNNLATQASVSFSTPQTIDGNICQSVNVTSSNLTNNNGVDMGNNSGITFSTPVAGSTLYWVGNTTGNSKAGTFSTGVNNSWSNPDNWSLASGSYTGTNSCIPSAADNVVFDAASFSAGAADVNMDLQNFFCNDMTWSGIPSGVTLDDDSSSISRFLYVFGNLTWGGSNMSNNYEGTTLFSATSVTTRTITNNTTRFGGGVIFDYSGGNWTLNDDADIQGDNNGDVTIRNGALDVGNSSITLDDDWTVSSTGTYTFTPGGNAVVTFDGAANSVGTNYITVDGTGNFNDIVINRGGAGSDVKLGSAITVENDFTIIKGYLYDEGYQITGNATGTFTMAKYGNMNLGKNGASTLFPTNYIAANISLDPDSWVKYNSSIAQIVSGVPDYGALFITNTTSSLKTKTLTEDVVIQTYLMIDDYNNFIDDGYQISFDAIGTNIFEMDANSVFTIGTAASATTFPLNYTPASVDIANSGSGSTIIYNGGSAQVIEGVYSGFADANYSNVELVQPGVGSVTKTLNGNARIRGNLTIGADNIMDVSGSNYDIFIHGDWTDNGSFNEQSGSVTFTGSTLQTIDGGGNPETYYDLVFDNGNATGISFADDIVVTNTVTFTDGIVTPASTELFYINDNAYATGASNASYVDGQVRKIGDDPFIYPVGDDGYYAPIEISAPSVNTDHFTAQYINTDPNGSYNVYSHDPSIDHLSRCEYWNLAQTGGTSSVTVSLSWGSPRSCSVTSLPDLVVARWDGTSTWKDHGNGGTTGNTTSGTVASSSSLSLFGPFTLASISSQNPLPVKLLSFTAMLLNNEHVKLNWTTATEINNDHFIVERSVNGLDFNPIQKVNGAGNSSTIINYQITDSELPKNTTTLYYRLKQVDFDGQYTFSNIETVEINKEGPIAFNIFPNPSEGDFTIQFDELTQEVNIEITNILGELVFNTRSNKNIVKAHFSTGGVYFVAVYTGDQQNRIVHKLVIR